MSAPRPQQLDAVLIGAQKSATSSLAAWLEGVPEVCHSAVKETYFWDVDRRRDGGGWLPR